MPSSVIAQLDTYGPQQCEQLNYAQAHEYTRQLTLSQYENFTVVSWLLPRRLRDHFMHIYAFCRWADDLGDEAGDPAKSVELLAWWRRELDACYANQPRHPVFVALRPTIEQFNIPRQPFDHLIDAFVQDQSVNRYKTWDQVLDYCTRSADPVGRLVLYLSGYRDPQRQQYSDATCTALQLANFWQDVRRDILERNRVYIPADVARRHGLDIDLMVQSVRADESGRHGDCGHVGCPSCNLPSVGITAIQPAFRATMHELVQRTWPLFTQGRYLWPLVSRDVRVDIQLFTLGGESILKMIRNQNYDTLLHRPKLSKASKLTLMFRAAVGKLLSLGSSSGGRDSGGDGGSKGGSDR